MVSMSKAKMELRPLPKRFYAAVGVQQNEDGFCITLDGKNVLTPARKMLQVAAQPLVQQIAAEWDAQVEVIDTDSMPLTRLAHIALDRVAHDRAALLADIAGYGETDLLCYRAPVDVDREIADPAAANLRKKQGTIFDPILAWSAQQFGIVFDVTEGIMPVAQPDASLAALNALYAQSTDWELAALAMLVPIFGSALLALAVWKEFLGIDAALLASHLDEDCQGEHWGADAEVAAKWASKCRDARAAAFFLTYNSMK